MLVLITCLSVWVAWETQHARRQARAIAGIEALGGQVRTSEARPTLFERTVGLLGSPSRGAVTEVHFLGPNVGDANLDDLALHAAELTGLEKLTFIETSVTDAGAERLRQRLPGVEVKLVMPLLAPPLMRVNPENMPNRRP